MRVIIGEPDKLGLQLQDVHDLRHLSVSSELCADQIQAALDEWDAGIYAGNHCWLTISTLREHGPVDEEWRYEFDNMIAKAASHGWVAADWVRAHVE